MLKTIVNTIRDFFLTPTEKEYPKARVIKNLPNIPQDYASAASLYWHFVKRSELDGRLKLSYCDGREVKQGEQLTVVGGAIELCKRGLHASSKLIDAVCYGYAGKTSELCLVSLDGELTHSFDKSVARSRTVIGILDNNELLECMYETLLEIAQSKVYKIQDVEFAQAYLQAISDGRFELEHVFYSPVIHPYYHILERVCLKRLRLKYGQA